MCVHSGGFCLQGKKQLTSNQTSIFDSLELAKVKQVILIFASPFSMAQRLHSIGTGLH